MTTNPHAAGPMGNWPRSREELNRYAWNRHAPEILAAMNVTGDPGPVPRELMNEVIEWPEDDVVEAMTTAAEEDFDELYPDEVTAVLVELQLMGAEREDRLRISRQFRSVTGHLHAEPSAAVRRYVRGGK